MSEEQDFTVEELTGETEEATPEVPVVEAAPPERAEEPTGEEAPAPPKEEPPPETPAEEPAKEPPGYVRQEALREERERRKDLQRELEELRGKAPPAEPVKKPADLILEDPEASITMLTQQIEDMRLELTRRDLDSAIKAKVPDFQEKTVQMEELLLERGFSEEGITKLVQASGNNVPELFELIRDAMESKGSKSARETIEAELTPKITAAITKQIMEKFNIAAPPTNIGSLPGGSPEQALHVDGEGSYSKLTPEQQEKWLKGEL